MSHHIASEGPQIFKNFPYPILPLPQDDGPKQVSAPIPQGENSFLRL